MIKPTRHNLLKVRAQAARDYPYREWRHFLSETSKKEKEVTSAYTPDSAVTGSYGQLLRRR